MNRRHFLKLAASLLPLPAFVPAGSLWLPPERPRVALPVRFTTQNLDILHIEDIGNGWQEASIIRNGTKINLSYRQTRAPTLHLGDLSLAEFSNSGLAVPWTEPNPLDRQYVSPPFSDYGCIYFT